MARQARIVVFLAGLVALYGCAGTINQDDALAVVPYRVEGNGRIIVQARVNEQGPYDFALDTGSTISVVFDEMRKKLDLEPRPDNWTTIQGIVTSGQFQLLTIRLLQIGPEVWTDARVAILPGDTLAGKGIDGVLGIDFLRRYAVGFSAADRVVRLYPPDLVRDRAYRGWASVPLSPLRIGSGDATLYFFALRIGGQDVLALLDLGSGLNLINWHAARSLGFDPVRIRTDGQLSGAVDTAPIAARFTAESVRTAGVRWRNEEFAIADTEIFTLLAQGDRPLAILGAGFLGQRDFIIDFVRNRLLIYLDKGEVDNVSHYP